jgi:FtsH-binding integral membrane protein
MTLTQKIKNNYLDVFLSVLALICVFALYVFFAVISPTDYTRKGIAVYFALCAIPLILLGVFGFRSMKEKSLFQKLIFVLTLALIFVFIILHATIRTDDYHVFLGRWTYSYKNLSIKDALYSTLDVSNYTPVYNYLLILV